MQALIPLLVSCNSKQLQAKDEIIGDLTFYVPSFMLSVDKHHLDFIVGGSCKHRTSIDDTRWRIEKSYGELVLHHGDSHLRPAVLIFTLARAVNYWGNTTEFNKTTLPMALATLRVALETFLASGKPELAAHNQQILDQFLKAVSEL